MGAKQTRVDGSERGKQDFGGCGCRNANALRTSEMREKKGSKIAN